MCTCGDPNPHVVAKRRTADGIDLHFWDDGAITQWHGVYVMHGGRSARGVKRRRAVCAQIVDNVCLYDFSEIKTLIKERLAHV